MADVVVVGAGISGAATAYNLAMSGVSVTLIDRWGPAAMASGWTLAGVRQSGRHAAELPLAQAAVADWEGLAETLDAPTHYTQQGNLRLARTEAHLAQLTAMVAGQRDAGLDLVMLDQAALHDRAPAIAPDVLGASFCATDGHADPHATVAAFVAAAERAGAVLRFGEAVVAIETEAGRVSAVRTTGGRIACGGVVLATGVMGNALLAPLGLSVPMVPRAVTLLRTAPVAPVLAQVVGIADASCAGRQEVDGRFRFTGAGAPFTGTLDFPQGAWIGDRRVGPRLMPKVGDVARIAQMFGALVPATLDATLDESWVGLIDSTPDALPVIEAPAAVPGLVLGMGFSGHGFCLGPVTGRILAALAREEPPNLPIDAFRLKRFATQSAPAEPLTLHG
ncbi:FAD-binding oxidoreductase [Acidisphaera sp. L21]|uniref:NAD(P)/FAD-dependent oxidoreductase n=1 Tax=Acidisphaera sp. L21 TaxID=1641851 RepID=UPI00131C0EE2|nr:FAD-binding oxidoreductase [Acidisphaera sp. L21]